MVFLVRYKLHSLTLQHVLLRQRLVTLEGIQMFYYTNLVINIKKQSMCRQLYYM